MSLPVRGAWIEMFCYGAISHFNGSLPVRGAWIEILYLQLYHYCCPVAPCEGSVD